MATATLRRELDRLRRAIGQTPARPAQDRLDQFRRDPARLLAGMTPDGWQASVLRSHSPRTLLLASRQSGKSTVAAAVALREALLRPDSLVLILSPSLRQSGEFYRDKLVRLYNRLGRPVPVARETALTMELANGSRVISLPESEGTIRGYSGVRLLVLDEASRIDDGLLAAARPMLAVSRGKLIALSTPFGRRGWFYEAWQGGEGWQRFKVTADDCPRISREFLESERLALGARYFDQEYRVEFVDTVGAVFMQSDIDAAFAGGTAPLFAGR